MRLCKFALTSMLFLGIPILLVGCIGKSMSPADKAQTHDISISPTHVKYSNSTGLIYITSSE